jgi:hypothetical protein
MLVGPAQKKKKMVRLEFRSQADLLEEVRVLRAEKANMVKELRQPYDVKEILKAHAYLQGLGSDMLLNLARALNKRVLDPKT